MSDLDYISDLDFMKEIIIPLGSPLHKAALKYKKHFGYCPRQISDEEYNGPATEAQLLAEVDRCIAENEEMDFWFGYTAEQQLAVENMPLYDPPIKTTSKD